MVNTLPGTAPSHQPAADGHPYRVTVFAHNEEDLIESSVGSILQSFGPGADLRVYVLVNGSTDRTLEIVEGLQARNPAVVPVRLRIADKCNAWNYSVYRLSDDSPCHFFMDGDCQCPPGVLQGMWKALAENPAATGVAGVPLSGRNCRKYQQLQIKWSMLYGNLYAVARPRLRRIVELGLKLPLGMNLGDDHVITQLLLADIPVLGPVQQSRLVIRPELGFTFPSLQPYRWDDWVTYFKRLVNYRLRRYHLVEFERSGFQLPRTMDAINKKILAELEDRRLAPHQWVDRAVRRRLRERYPTPDARYYDLMLDEAV